MEISGINCWDCSGTGLLAYAVMAAAAFFFPVGALVLRRRRRDAGPAMRALITAVTLLSIPAAPLAAVLLVTAALSLADDMAAIVGLARYLGVWELLPAAAGLLALRLLLPRDRLVTLRLGR